MAWLGERGVGVMLNNNILIYGGSFDPIHLGHLNTALAVQKHMQFGRFIFLPCKTPVLKKATTATCEQRIHMLELALAPYPKFAIDLREIQRDTPSFMVDTLKSFRDELGGQAAMTLLLGMDAFLQLPHWHAWEKILKLSHLLVIKRATIDEKILSEELKTLLNTHETINKADLLDNPYGKIYQYNAGEYPISSSDLRQKIKTGEDARPYLPEGIDQYLKIEKLYL